MGMAEQSSVTPGWLRLPKILLSAGLCHFYEISLITLTLHAQTIIFSQ